MLLDDLYTGKFSLFNVFLNQNILPKQYQRFIFKHRDTQDTLAVLDKLDTDDLCEEDPQTREQHRSEKGIEKNPPNFFFF